MLEAGYERVRGARVRGAEIAFRAEDVAAALRPRPTSIGANHRAPGEGGHAAEPWRWAAQERVTQVRGSRWKILP